MIRVSHSPPKEATMLHTRRPHLVLVLTVALLGAPRLAQGGSYLHQGLLETADGPAACAGDCNGDDMVTVNEIIDSGEERAAANRLIEGLGSCDECLVRHRFFT